MTLLTTDCAFRIGSQHLRSGLPCQDYAVAGVNPDDGAQAYAIVGDGCSSGGKTDVGARIVALTAEQCLLRPRTFADDDLKSVCRGLGLGVRDLLATTVMAQIRLDTDVAIRIAGDGVVAVKYRDGHVEATKAEWADNMPWYPAYGINPVDFDGFLRAHAGNGDEAFKAETWGCRESNCEVIGSTRLSALQGASGFSWRVDCDGVAVIAAFSDGVCQVEGMPWQEVVVELLAFKTTEGDFVKRRMNRFLRDHTPLDDISCAAILVEP